MHKKLILGTVLLLTLTLAFPVTAAEERAFAWPSFDVVEWVFGLLEILGLEWSVVDMASEADLIELGSGSEEEVDPARDPYDEEEQTAEMGPGLDPLG